MTEINHPAAAAEICETRGLLFQGHVASGAYKHTFLVSDQQSQRYALKVMGANQRPDRAEREFAAMRACDHPSIAQVMDVGTFQHGLHEITFSIEEYYPGGTLRDRLVSTQTLNREETFQLAFPIIDALRHMDARRIVHRDIKPENIMFADDGRVVVVDFGLVRDLSEYSLTNTWQRIGPGTPLYSAPEQLNNEKEIIDWRTDQFSLGVVLFEVYFGYHPYLISPEESALNAVLRVEKRSAVPQGSSDAIGSANLGPISTMIQPWSNHRYRTPELLIKAWSAIQ